MKKSAKMEYGSDDMEMSKGKKSKKDCSLSAAKAKKSHPGFKAVENKIAKKEGISKDRAGAILASASRKASGKAHKANPRLNKVKGSEK